jgi:hypothetical protein
MSKLKTIHTKSLVYPPLTECLACHARPTCQSSDMKGKPRRNLKYGREGCLAPFRRRSPIFSRKVYPPHGPVLTSAGAHCMPQFTYSNFLIRQSQPSIAITPKFISPFQIDQTVCLFPSIHTKPSFPHSFPNLN